MDKFLNNTLKKLEEPHEEIDPNLRVIDNDVNEPIENAKNANKKLSNNSTKSSSKKNYDADPNDKFCSLYVEAESDDEFAREYFMYPADDENPVRIRKNKKLKRKKMSDNSESPKTLRVSTESPLQEGEEEGIIDTTINSDDDKCIEEGDGDDSSEEIDYRIQYILDSRILTPTEWRDVCGPMDTRELTRGSVLKQPDSEFFDDSPIIIEKFLVKWMHASFLHVSWETEKDLNDLCGTMSKNQIKKYRARILANIDLFEDLRKGEVFPPQYIQIDRVLNVDDSNESIDPLTIDWGKALLPQKNTLFSGSNKDTAIAVDAATVIVDVDVDGNAVDENEPQEVNDDNDENNRSTNNSDDNENVISHRKSASLASAVLNKSKKHSKSQKSTSYLHGGDCWLHVKWEGQSYSEMSVEHVADLRRAKVDYEWALREFYRREQQVPGVGLRGKCVRSLYKAAKVLESPQPPPLRAGTLRDYQWEGVRWLLFNWSQKRNSILADEMGLGKTIQTAAFLQMLKTYQGLRGPFLIVAPLSTVVNWQREISAWTDMDAIVYHGSQEDRELMRKLEFSFINRKKVDGVKVEIVIASPETCMSSAGGGCSAASASTAGARTRKELSKVDWELIVVDEAHKLKNYDSKISTTLREEYAYRNVVLLTGTPLQNSTDELWTLLNFIDREAFVDREAFIKEFGSLKTTAQLESLHARLKPYLLRREKDHVEKTVPPKEELIVEVELTVPQKQYYRAIYEQNTRFLFRGEAKDGPRLCNLAMELRKCCNHPFLIKGAEKVLADHFVGDSPLEVMVKASGKMALLDKLLPKLQADGHRVLIFSQFRIMLDIIEDYMALRGFSYERVDGAVTGKKRQAAIDRYSAIPADNSTPHDSIFAMLLSTRAGGVGINLTAADTVIIFDSDWNPQNDLQAQARAHRIGQTKPVKVYRLLMRKSYEMVMFKAASLKLGLDYAVMHNMNTTSTAQEHLKQIKQSAVVNSTTLGDDDSDDTPDTAAAGASSSGAKRGRRGKAKSSEVEGISMERTEHMSSLSKRDLENLLKHGAYDIFREEKDGATSSETRKFYDADIDEILQQAAVVVHDERGKSSLSKTSSASFAKASFVSSISTTGSSNNIALDDPDFWTKVVGLASKEEDGVASHRKRKCAQDPVSYKDPGSSQFKARGEVEVEDSDEEEDEGATNSGKKRKNKSSKDDPQPFEMSDENFQKILISMLSRGYGNWDAIAVDTKLFWAANDMSYVCRLVLLQLLKSAAYSVQKDSPIAAASATDSDGLMVIDAVAPVTEGTQQNSKKVIVDAKYLETFLRRSRACRLALASVALNSRKKFKNSSSTESTADDQYAGGSDDQPSGLEMEDEIIEQAVSVAKAACTEGLAGDEVDCSGVLRTFYEAFDVRCAAILEGIPPVTDSGDHGENEIQMCDKEVMSIRRTMECLHSLQPLAYTTRTATVTSRTASFFAAAVDAESAIKARNAARLKLSQLEDLFELCLVGKLAAASAIALAPTTEHTESVATESTPASVPMEVQFNEAEVEMTCPRTASVPSVFSPALECVLRESAVVLGVSRSADWTEVNDLLLVDAVHRIGWPEGKRKLAMFTDSFANAGVCVVKPTALDPEVAVTNSTDEEEEEERKVTATAAANADSAFDNKTMIRRVKQIAQILREIGRKPIVLEEKKVVEKLKTIDVESLAQKENRRFAQCILKSLFKLGRPRSMYVALAQEIGNKIEGLNAANQEGTAAAAAAATTTASSAVEYFDARKYLLTWNEFLADVAANMTEAGAEFDVSAELGAAAAKVQEAVAALFRIGEDIINGTAASPKDTIGAEAITATASTGDTDAAKSADTCEEAKPAADDITKSTNAKIVKNGIFAKTTYRTIENCLDRCHLLHQTRLALCHHGLDNFFQLRASIRRECKGAGPSCPKPKRDQNLPVWWTVYHDVSLLKETLESITISASNNKDGGTEAVSVEEENADAPDANAKEALDDNKKEGGASKDKDAGCANGFRWQLIASNDSVFRAAPNFTMPHKVNGVEWNTALTAKIAEKRFLSVIAANGVVPVNALVPPCSPDVTSRKASAASASVKASTKRSLFGNQTGIIYGQRPSWAASLSSSSSASAITTSKHRTSPESLPLDPDSAAAATFSLFSGKEDKHKSSTSSSSEVVVVEADADPITEFEDDEVVLVARLATVSSATKTTPKEKSKTTRKESSSLEYANEGNQDASSSSSSSSSYGLTNDEENANRIVSPSKKAKATPLRDATNDGVVVSAAAATTATPGLSALNIKTPLTAPAVKTQQKATKNALREAEEAMASAKEVIDGAKPSSSATAATASKKDSKKLSPPTMKPGAILSFFKKA